jgi:DNA-binding transcriptional ArsR family regulator
VIEAFTYTDTDGNVRDQAGRIVDAADPLGQVLPLAETSAQVAARLIRQNGLVERRDGDAGDGGEQQTAVDRRYIELRSRLLDASGLLTIPVPVPIVEGLLYRDSLAWLTGKPGHGKSLTAVDIACCVGTGTEWHGHRVTRGKVVYLIAEGASGLGLRVEAWTLRAGRRVEQVLFLPVPVQLWSANVDTTAFTRLLADLQPDLVILDTQARVTVGAEENSARDMGQFVDALEQVRGSCGACVLPVHHDARNGENLRGSTAIEGAATTILRAAKDGRLVTISNPKQKDGPETEPLTLAITPLGRSVILSHEAVGIDLATRSSEDRILTILRESFGTDGASKTELREAAELPKSTYYRAVNDLLEGGLIKQRKIGRSKVYTLATDDRQDEIPTSPTESHDP